MELRQGIEDCPFQIILEDMWPDEQNPVIDGKVDGGFYFTGHYSNCSMTHRWQEGIQYPDKADAEEDPEWRELVILHLIDKLNEEDGVGEGAHFREKINDENLNQWHLLSC